MSGLTPPERETVINLSDADDTMVIWTAQRRLITKLRGNPAARLVDEGYHGTTEWASFEMPADLLTFRSRKRAGRSDPAAQERLRRARERRKGAA